MIKAIKLAPIYFLLKKNSEQDYPIAIKDGKEELLDKDKIPNYSTSINEIQKLFFDTPIPSPIAFAILEELSPLNEILLYNRPISAQAKHPVIIKFIEKSIAEIKKLCANPKKVQKCILYSRYEWIAEFIELLVNSRLEIDYKEFLGAGNRGSVLKDNIAKGMYDNILQFLTKKIH